MSARSNVFRRRWIWPRLVVAVVWFATPSAAPGERVFFLVPQAWTGHYLTLRLSQSAAGTHSMIGRTELVADERRMILKKLAVTPTSKPDWIKRPPSSVNHAVQPRATNLTVGAPQRAWNNATRTAPGVFIAG